ncbi:putative inositol 5-phosphatase [Schistosoma mansoni]|uniref:putative inositol 5-phosphatase n=1 Tax=Schistosoma mansoni TaxID=6183 RepID=UPI00022DC5A1|nr:putative inositol 5-phosphatase [Schistosoma mansoni]|eukprot:XP_018652984.1 putative inositol 5-phosphatase [Schistosoma mansoni]
MDSSPDGSSISESTLTSGTYTLPVGGRSQIRQRGSVSRKFEPSIIYTPNYNYRKNDTSENYRPLSAPKTYSSNHFQVMNSDYLIKYPELDYSRESHSSQPHDVQIQSNGNYNIRSSYEIELNSYKYLNNKNNSSNRSHSRFNTITGSFSHKSLNDGLKFYSSVRSRSNPFKVDYNQENTSDAQDRYNFLPSGTESHRRPLLYNLQNQSKPPHTNDLSGTYRPLSSHEKHLSTRSLCSRLPSQKNLEQTTEIGLYKTAMFVIPAPTSSSLPNVQNDDFISYRKSATDQSVHNYNHNRRQHHHHRHRDNSDSFLNTRSNEKVRTYICKGCGRSSLKRKKAKNSTYSLGYSCLSLDKCSTPQFINPNNNLNNHSHHDMEDDYERIIYQSPGYSQEDNIYYTSVDRSYNPNVRNKSQCNVIPNSNVTSLDQIQLCDNLPKSLKHSHQTSRSDCNKIIVDIKPRQMNEADKQQHINQWIQLGTLGDTASSPTISPLPPDEYQDKDFMIHSSRYSNEQDNDDEDAIAITTDNEENQDYNHWIDSQVITHHQEIKHKESFYDQHKQQESHDQSGDKEVKIQIIKQQTNLDLNDRKHEHLNESGRPMSNYTNTSNNEIKLEFVNNPIHNNNDFSNDSNTNHTTSSEIGSMNNRIIIEQVDSDTNHILNNNIVKKISSQEALNEPSLRSTSTEDITSNSKYNKFPNERIITIKDLGGLNDSINKSSIGKHSPTLSLNIDSDGYTYSMSSVNKVPHIPPKPKLNHTDEILMEKKNTPTLITSEIRYMNSKVSSHLSNITNMNSLLLNTTNLNHLNTTLNHSTESTTDLFPNLVKTRDTPIPNVKSLVSYFTELIKIHTDIQDMNQSSNHINKHNDYDTTYNQYSNIQHEDENDLDIPANISPFLLHHETPYARERRLQAVEMLRRRSTIHMSYDRYRVFPPGYSNSTSPILERLHRNNNNRDHRHNDDGDDDDDDHTNYNGNNNHNIMKHQPIESPKYQVRMQANLQKDSTAIAAQ